MTPLALVLGLFTALAPVTPASIDDVVAGYLDSTGVPGVAVAVTHGTDVVRVAGYGKTSAGAPVTEHTAMPVASVSKSFTALAVMQLVEQGEVSLDGAVHTYLPEFEMADPRASRITVRQLLDQTSGLSDRTFAAFSGPQPKTLRDRVAQLRDVHLASDPGAEFEYHNPNYQVAARLVEVVSGSDFASYLRTHVFGPLGMNDSFTVDTADDLPGAVGHITVAGVHLVAPEPSGFGNGSGAVLSSAHDMAAWLIAQRGTPILSDAGLRTLHTPTRGSYALGWSVDKTPSGAQVVEHSGDLFTATAHQALLPEYGVAVMANAANGVAQELAYRLIALLENRSVPAPDVWGLRVVDGALLLGAAGVVVLTVRGRRSRWMYLLLLPMVLLVFLNTVVGWLYRGRDVAWIQVAYLFPSFVVFLVVASLCGVFGLLFRFLRRES